MRPQKIMYCAMPTRLRAKSEIVRQMARNAGFVPVIPFDIGSFDDFENNPRVGRERTIRLMKGMQLQCDITGVFGISEGTMIELDNGLRNLQEIRIFPDFDPEWDTYYAALSSKYGDPLQRLRGSTYVIVFVGPSAIGKTFWMDWLLMRHAQKLARIKNTTTRAPRNEKDHESYEFISREAFEERIVEKDFLEHDQYLGNYYGSSWTNIKLALSLTHGMFALTPQGAEALAAHRLEFNIQTLLLKPASEDVLKRNLARRGITGGEVQTPYLERAASFTLPASVPHSVIAITGNKDRDESSLRSILEPLLG